LGSERRARGLGQAQPAQSPSPTLRVGAGKSAVGGDEYKVSSPQVSVPFSRQAGLLKGLAPLLPASTLILKAMDVVLKFDPALIVYR
jgi:hypothetical protein